MRRLSLGLALAAACLAPVAAPVTASAADRKPTANELASIEQVLRAEGFVQWDDIEWDDDGYWEVDDARTSTGQQYDLRLDQTFNVIEREED